MGELEESMDKAAKARDFLLTNKYAKNTMFLALLRSGSYCIDHRPKIIT